MSHVTMDSTNRADALRAIFGPAAREASTAMQRWSAGRVTLSLDDVCESSLDALLPEVQMGDELMTLIVLTMGGELGGQLILAFTEPAGRQMCEALIGVQGTGPGWSELEQSGLMETGNILACAYVNALTHSVKRRLIPGPPQFIEDFGACVLEQALMAQAMNGDNVLVCRTSFRYGNETLPWSMYFVPDAALRQALDQAVNEYRHS
ncbi:MAG: hypothetical protein JNM18_06965 [Planctomycetaceae bacterium]|nr:hypothetical protein [Planctomycetaceae bacterium]